MAVSPAAFDETPFPFDPELLALPEGEVPPPPPPAGSHPLLATVRLYWGLLPFTPSTISGNEELKGSL